MKIISKIFILFLCLFVSFCSCSHQGDIYTIGIFQVNDAPTLNEVREGFIQALKDNGLIDEKNIQLIVRNGKGDISKVHRIAQEFVQRKVDMIVPLSTPCLQAALISNKKIPVVFSSIANPYILGAGKSPTEHLDFVTGVSSRGPIKQALIFIKKAYPDVKKLGTLWTPSEKNSEYYLKLAKKNAAKLGLEIIPVAVKNKREVFLSAQILINKKIDAIYQISDNTINDSFEIVGRVAEENTIPLFGGFVSSTSLGACAAIGWDFFEMGYKTGLIAVQVKNGKKIKDIPIQYMQNIKLHLNLKAAKKQKIRFSEDIINDADEIIDDYQDSSNN
jgi:putative ABC transport system substrate-binding protein